MQGAERSRERIAEAVRWLLLLIVTTWLVHPYFAPRLIGTSDALWYHHVLADAVTQFRAGVFPVLVGQSEFSFNGSVYPLRAAPYYQYFAGLLDLVTGHSLGFFALEHLAMILSFLGGAFAAYGALVWIAPGRRWTALMLALLYVMCPGVAGLFYAQDLYMSGMTLPWIPIAFAAFVRSFDDERQLPLSVLAMSLAALWWAHSPIASWAMAIAAIGQVLRIFVQWPGKAGIARAGIAAVIFCALAAYPVVSVFQLRAPGEPIVPYVMDRELLLKWVGGSFPSSIQPIDLNAPILSYMQLGYSLWIVLISGAVVWIFRKRIPSVGALLAASVFLLLLVFPIPGITRGLWFSFPETLVGMTLYWPMQRFYILIAAATIVCAQRLQAEHGQEKGPTWAVILGCLCVGILWSGFEFSKLIEKTGRQADTVEDSRRWSLLENVAVQRHTYGLFARRPSYFTHGVVEPRMESRLLDPVTGRIVASDYDIARGQPVGEEFRGSIDANPGILDLEPALTIQSGGQYLLTFNFAHEDTTGLLQMTGDHFYREYILPESGDSKSFGSGPGNEKSITVWTTVPGTETINLRFIPTAQGAKLTDYMPFANFRLQPIDVNSLPVRADSLIPYRATVKSPQPALLEAPRMFVPGYEATVDGAPAFIRKSPEGLVAFPVPKGESHVVLRFVGPVALRAAFWLSATGWFIAVLWVAIRAISPAARRPA